jgi:hypothetical protein
MIKLADLQYPIFAASAHSGSWHFADIANGISHMTADIGCQPGGA